MVTYLPDREILGHALNDVNTEKNFEKRKDLFKKLSERIIEHSDEKKALEIYLCE